MYECKEGVCQVAHNCPWQEKKLPCLNCGPLLLPLNNLKLSMATLKKSFLSERKKKRN